MLNLLPVLHAKFEEFVHGVETDDTLATRDQAIVGLALALAGTNQDEIRAAAVFAKQNGVSNAEIGAVAARVLVRSVRPLSGGKVPPPSSTAPANQSNTCCR